MGYTNVIKFGVVEDINDPEKLGRCKVRVIGDHTQDKTLIPTEDLPWAVVLMPVTSASVSGIGDAPCGIMKGTWVALSYIDGSDNQQPIILGSIPGLPVDPPDPSIGFNDPGVCFPAEDKVGEPDTNRLARGIAGKHVIEHTSVGIRRSSVLSNIATAFDSWSEPETPYAALYPYNKVWEGPYNVSCDGCEWGHIEEWDSTPGAERYFRQHKTSQNFLEIHPDGKEVRKIHGDNFELDLNSKHLYIKGDYRVTIEGNKDERIKGDYYQHIEGNHVCFVDKSSTLNVKKNILTRSGEKTIRRSEQKIYDMAYESIIRKSNQSIQDIAFMNYTAISGMESTIGTAMLMEFEFEPFVSEVMTGDSFSSTVSLSCSAANTTKETIDTEYYTELPQILFEDVIVAMDQVKVAMGTIHLETTDIHNIGTIHAPFTVCPLTNFQIITVLEPIPTAKATIGIFEEILPDPFTKKEYTTVPTVPGSFLP